jgi:hypothetical protein
MSEHKPVLQQARTLQRMNRCRRRMDSVRDVRSEMIRVYHSANRGRICWTEAVTRIAVLDKIKAAFVIEAELCVGQPTDRSVNVPNAALPSRVRELLEQIAGGKAEVQVVPTLQSPSSMDD